MSEENRLYKQLYSGGYAAYAALLILAILFYHERTAFLDIAYHLFHILRTGNFAIQANRYGAVVTQVFPLVAGRLSLSLTAAMVIYSAGYIIYYISCYFICGTVLKNYRLALVLLFAQLLLTTETFYWMQSELQQGLAFMIVVLAWLNNLNLQKPGIFNITVAVIFIIFLNFFHPLLIVPVFYALAFLFINKRAGFQKWVLVSSGIFFLLVYYAKSELFVTAYEQKATSGVNNFIYMFPHYFGIASNRRFLAHCLDKFYWLPILSSIIGVAYLYHKKWLLFSLFTISAIAFLLLVNVSYPHTKEPDFYMENFYLPLGFIMAFPLVYDVLPLLKKRNIAIIFSALIIVSGITRIYIKHNTYTARLNWERNFLVQHRDEKLLIDNKEVPMDTLIMTWGTPYEFWLLSTTEYGKTASIVIDEHIDKLLYCKWENKEFITIMDKIKYEMLPPPYFHLTDTITHYDRLGVYELPAQ